MFDDIGKGLHGATTNDPNNPNDGTDLEDIQKVLDETVGRKAPPLPVIDPGYIKGSDLDASADGVTPLDVTAGGTSAVTPGTQFEFVHYGYVFKASAASFSHNLLDDMARNPLFAGMPGGRALMVRGALEREALLLGQFISGVQAAIAANVQQKTGVGDILGMLGNLFGSASPPLQTADLNPYFDRVNAVIGQLDVDNIDYPTLHAAGVELHSVRSSYRQFLKEQLEKLEAAPSMDTTPGAGALANLPFLKDLLPPEIGQVLDFVQKLLFKPQDCHLALVMEFALRLEPAIERVCKDMTEDAIRKRFDFVFPVWFVPPSFDPFLPPVPANPSIMGYSNDDLGGALQDVQSFFDEVNQTIQDVRDFLSLPDGFTRGRPFLDKVFEFDVNGSPLDDKAIQMVAANAFGKALGIPEVPEIFAKIIGGFMSVIVGFLRNFYTKLLLVPALDFSEGAVAGESADDADTRLRGAFQAAADTALVQGLIDVVLQAIGILDDFRDLTVDLSSMPPIYRVVSAEQIVRQILDMVGGEISKGLSKVTVYAISEKPPTAQPGMPPPMDTPSLYDILLSAKTQAGTNGLTMETYLGVLPAASAMIMQRIFFPFWDLLMQYAFSPIQGPLNDVSTAISGAIGTASNLTLEARNEMERAARVCDYLASAPAPYFDPTSSYTPGGPLPSPQDMTNIDDIGKGVGDAFNAPDPFAAAPSNVPVALVNMANRKRTGTAQALTDALLAQVTDLKWDTAKTQEEADAAAAEAAAKEAAEKAAKTSSGATAPAAPPAV